MHSDGHLKKCMVIKFLLLLLISGCGSINLKKESPILSESYVIIIDAESSGSSIFIYEILSDTYDDIPHIVLKGSGRVSPGISEYEDNPQLAARNLNLLIDEAKAYIPVSKWRKVPLYLFATDGMRLLSHDKRSRILNQIDSHFRSNGTFLFQPPLVISGKYESFCGWLAANYLDDLLDPSTDREGVLEMDDGSVHIAYTTSTRWSKHSVKRTLRGRDYAVNALSFLYLGNKSARLFSQTPSCFPMDSDYEGQRADGKDSFTKCREGILENFNAICENISTSVPYCIFANNSIKFPNGNYFALSSFNEMYSFLKEDNEISSSDFLSLIKKKGSEICDKRWKNIKNVYSDGNKELLRNSCFDISYSWLLLFQGFKLTETRHHLKPVKTFHGVDVNWTMGVAIDMMMGNAVPSFTP